MNDFRGRFRNTQHAKDYILAGKAYITIRSTKTDNRYTFKIKKVPDSNNLWWVSYLTGPDNTKDYTYVGSLKGTKFELTKKSVLTRESLPVRAFDWVIGNLLINNRIDKSVQIWHEGRCGRCGRMLTVPDSVERGIGPECATKMIRCEAA